MLFCLAAFDTNSFLKKPATVSNIPAPPITYCFLYLLLATITFYYYNNNIIFLYSFLFIDPVLNNSSHILTISFLTPVLNSAKLAIRRDNISTHALGTCGITIATPLPNFAYQISLIIFLYFWLFDDLGLLGYFACFIAFVAYRISAYSSRSYSFVRIGHR